MNELINLYLESYMEKVFYFCLKKTANSNEAEDLSSDISMCIFAQIKKGIIPENFSAWVWKIANNRYCLWADRKRRTKEFLSGADIEDFKISGETSIENEYLHKEELLLLRRELAFISSEYRDIIVAFYIDDIKAKDIAARLNVPESTIRSKLFRARNILKEGMNMAREFGVKSYKPEEVNFVNSCSSFGDNGQPWTILNHLLYKNIFLEVYENPETAEELSLELGIALPYMENELNFLTEQTFLIKEGDKYKTSFPIVSREAQEKIHQKNMSVSKEITSLLETLTDKFSALCRQYGINYYGNYQSYEDAKWTLLMRLFDVLLRNSNPENNGGKHEYTKRPDNGNWDIVGYQQTNIPSVPYVGLHGYMNDREDKPAVYFQQYKYQYKNIADKTPMFITHDEALTLKAVAEGKWEICESKYLKNLTEYGYITKTDDGYSLNIIVFEDGDYRKYLEKFSESECSEVKMITEKIKSILSEISSYSYKITREDLPKVFREDKRICRIACENSDYSRNYVLEQAVNDGWLKYDENTSRVIGAYIYI